jgi:hypothetical protein
MPPDCVASATLPCAGSSSRRCATTELVTPFFLGMVSGGVEEGGGGSMGEAELSTESNRPVAGEAFARGGAR